MSSTNVSPNIAAASTVSSYLFLTAHDYRTPRKANIHFLADEFKLRGQVRFFSLRYSNLSKYKNDIRSMLDNRSNRVERVDSVDCYLWKSVIHPFNTRYKGLRFLENAMYRQYAKTANPVLKQWITEASTIFFESGMSPLFMEMAMNLNPSAKKIYIASDDLDTINVADYIKKSFNKTANEYDAICLISRLQAKKIPSKNNVFVVPHGIDNDLETKGDPSPYNNQKNAVSVGSMLFDRTFFEYAGHAFPDITFHVIGSGQGRSEGYSENVIVYGEMPYEETLRYIKHATFGIAPYNSQAVPDYLSDSSMKLMQYDYFMLPAVCPAAVVGQYESRFGYIPGDNKSIHSAISSALVAPHKRTRNCITWKQVADRLCEPQQFEDTKI